MSNILIVVSAVISAFLGFYLIIRLSIWLTARKYKRFVKLKQMGGAVGTSGTAYSSYGIGETDFGGGDCGGGGD